MTTNTIELPENLYEKIKTLLISVDFSDAISGKVNLHNMSVIIQIINEFNELGNKKEEVSDSKSTNKKDKK